MGTKAKLEYIWLDGYQPTQSLRNGNTQLHPPQRHPQQFNCSGNSTESTPVPHG